MLFFAWLALFGAGVLTSIAAFYHRKAALYASVMNFFIWIAIAFGAVELTNFAGETASAWPVVPLAAGNAILSLAVAIATAVGDWGERETGMDGAGQGLPRPSTRARETDEQEDRSGPVPPAARVGGSR